MNRSKLLYCILCLMTVDNFRCDSGGNLINLEDVPIERIVAATVVYNSTDTNGGPLQQIVLFDLDNPENFRFISREDHISIQPRFSPDKHLLVFGDETIGSVHAPRLVLYDIHTNKADTLYWDPDSIAPLFAPTGSIVWDSNSEGFFLTNPPQSFSIRQDILYYDINLKAAETIYYANEYSVIPQGLKGSDSLIVLSNEEPATGKNIGYFIMSRDGEYVRSIENPGLKWSIRNGTTNRGLTSASWNNNTEQFSFSLFDSTLSRTRKIVITDLDGHSYKEITSGQFYDDYPEWGPDQNILVIRAPTFGSSYGESELMLITTDPTHINRLVSPEIFGGVAIRFADY